MGWVEMSERELRRAEVLGSVLSGRLTMTAAAGLMGVSRRQAHRLALLFADGGAAGLRHRARGRPSNRLLGPHVRNLALAYVAEHYRDFGPTFASQMLLERHGLSVSRETLRKWMSEDGLWLSRTQRRRFHQPRIRRDHFGELVQIDGSEHAWFEDRGGRCTLIVFIDDATSRLVALRFVASESAFAYFETLKGYLTSHGRPLAFYSDKHSIFRVSKPQALGGQGMTQFGRALSELSIEILCAHSSQAKGRVERVNRTLQDRLVKELRLAGISSIEAANTYLPGFVERFNARFATPPSRPEDLHRPLESTSDRLDTILAWREQRYVTQQLALSYDGKRVILDETPVTAGLVGKYVETYEFPDGRLEIRWKGVCLAYRTFDKKQRVTHAAIVENKRLSEVLAWVKARQDEIRPAPVKTTSEAGGYVARPKGRRRGRPSFVDLHIAAKGALPHASVGAAAICEVSAAPTEAPSRARL
ncbi:ISNCY family transposase [Bosea sp. BIWAKO-01]|uniref:ISNCY family transposase n=1 Tax=Bosea sp. BIWAKO-01 TaxID=506668 RepID=UPI000852D456|nr:ISNCY family transposase [Bosea sp. BIWAKO-01]